MTDICRTSTFSKSNGSTM